MASLTLVMFLASVVIFAYAVVQLIKCAFSAKKDKELSKSRLKRGGISVAVSMVLFLAMTMIPVKDMPKDTKIDAPKASHTPAPTETPAPAKESVVPVFYVDIWKSIDELEGKRVETTLPIKEINTYGRFMTDDRIKGEIRVETGDESFYKKKAQTKFATVRGTVIKKSGYYYLDNPEVVWSGTEAPAEYLEQLSTYEEAVRAAKIKAREDFIASAVEVSYDDLRRYPDSYKGKALKLYVYISEVEADGLLTVGTIYATYNGGEIGVYDKRELREPRLMAGDYITIYATGAGLSTMKVYEKGSGILGTDIGANVKEKYEIPVVEMLYTDQDNVEMFSASETESEDFYYNRGKEFANKLNGMLG